jgi:hypothetical protein
LARKLQFAKPVRGLIPAGRPRDRLAQFFEMRRAFYHCGDLMKEMEGAPDPESIAPVFARAVSRLALAATEFADILPENSE